MSHSAVWRDVEFTVRQLKKNPGLAVTAIVSLAFEIGATTAVFSLVYAVLMNPYPYRDSERLAYLMMRDKAGNERGAPYSASQVRQLRQVEALEGVIAMNDWSLTTTEGDLPDDAEALYFAGDGMQRLGVPCR